MLGIKDIRENPDSVKQNMQRKGRTDLDLIDRILTKDKEYRQLLNEEQQLRNARNTLSQQINTTKKEGGDIAPLLAQVKEIPEKIKAHTQKTTDLKNDIDQLLKQVPNIMADTVPEGKSDTDNVEIRKIGDVPQKEFDAIAHQEIAEKLGVADFDAAADVSGNGFYYLQGDLALLNQALIRFAIEHMVKAGFTYVETPLMLRGDVIKNVVDLADMESQIYKIDQDDLYLIGTSEHSLIGRYVNKTVQEKDLPITQTCYSMCFRREKGSHGLDEKGLFRTHQFNKVEMVVICKPEESGEWYKKMQDLTINIFTQLELPIRVLQMCTADLNDLKYDSVDIEAWSPRRNEYIEVASCSNLTQAQAQMLNIRVAAQPTYHPHTLNNTALATSRALVAILENNQTKDGKIAIPKVLQPYMFGKEFIE